MKRYLLKETKISETLAVAFQRGDDEIGFSIGNFSAMTVYGLEIEAWKEFVKAINRANIVLKLEELAN